MALLPVSTRKNYFKKLGLGEYNENNIRKLQKKYLRAQDVDGIYGTDTDRLLRHVYNCSQVPNFKPEEFKCPCGRCTGYPDRMKQVELNHIQTIRSHYGKPMKITSGLRCRYENQRAGGVSNSGHLTGYAVDFYIEGVTDTVPNRNKALSYIKTLPNHKFTYGAHMVDSDGAYREASGMGNCMHTETKKPVAQSLSDKILTECRTQADWMKHSKYKWQSNPTIAKSKYYGTCVTYVACVLQRLGYLKSGQFIWHTEKGRITGTNDKMAVFYMGAPLSSIKSKLKPGDIIIDGKPEITKAGQTGSHIFIFTGKWDGDNPIIWDNHSAQQNKGAYVYKRNRQVIAIIRLK